MCSWIEQGSVKITYRLIQPDLSCLDYGAMQWHSPNSPWGFGGIEYRYLSIHSNISAIMICENNIHIHSGRPFLLRL